jgi:hypothetical protein
MRTGFLFLGAYVLANLLIVAFISTMGGHMSGLLLVFPALPWSLLGNLLLGTSGVGIGTWVGLVLNAALIFGLGCWVGRRHTWPWRPEEDAE